MLAYKDGSTPMIGDVVRGIGHRFKKEVIGVVIGLEPAISIGCNIQIAYILLTNEMDRPDFNVFEIKDGLLMGNGPRGVHSPKMVGVYLGMEHGSCREFNKV